MLRRRNLSVAVVLGLSLALRLWGIGFSGSTPRGRPDEEIWFIEALRFFNPAPLFRSLELGYPEGIVLVFHALLRVQERALTLLHGREVNLACLFAVRPLAVLLPPRLLSAAAGTAACLFTGLTVRRLAPAPDGAGAQDPVVAGRAAVALGALALGCNYLAGREAHFGGTDTLVALGVAAALYLLVRAVQEGPRFLLLAALVAGAGFGLKFSAAGLALPCLVAGVAATMRERAGVLRALGWALASVWAAAAGFALFSARALAHPELLWRSLLGQSDRYDPSGRALYLLDPSAVTPPGWWFHASVTLPAAFGVAGLLAALAGLWLAARRDLRAALVLASAAVGFFALIAPIRLLFVRYASPLCPALAVGVGVVLAWSLQRFGRAGAAVVCAVLLGPPLVRLVQLDLLLARPDTRDEASAYLIAHGGPVVSQGAYAEHVHALEPGALAACSAVLPESLRRAVPVLPADTRDWGALVAAGRAGWPELANEALWRKIGSHQDPLQARYVAQAVSLLECGRRGKPGSARPLDPRWFALEKTFSPGAPACGSYVDLFDSFFVPFSGFAGQERPGPEVLIFRNAAAADSASLPVGQ